MGSPFLRSSALVLCASLAARAALAQSDNKVVAEALFQEGRRLMEAKRPAEACPRFAESQRVDPSPSTLLNLASCYEALGRAATAWATYREAASAATAAGRSDYVNVANKRANALFPRLSKLTVTAPSAPDGLVIRRDGSALERAALDVAIPIDPGEHTIAASAPGKKPWQSKIVVETEGSSMTVTIPPLENAAPDAPAPSASSATSATSVTTGAPPPQAPGAASADRPPSAAPSEVSPSGNGTRIAGYAIGAAGLGIGVVGGLLAFGARSKYSSSLDDCSPVDKNRCSQAGVDARDSARSLGNAATVAFAVSGAAIAAGITLLIIAPSSTSSARVELTPGPGGLGVRGAF